MFGAKGDWGIEWLDNMKHKSLLTRRLSTILFFGGALIILYAVLALYLFTSLGIRTLVEKEFHVPVGLQVFISFVGSLWPIVVYRYWPRHQSQEPACNSVR